MEIAEIACKFRIQNMVYCIIKTVIRNWCYNFVLLQNVFLAVISVFVCIKASMLKVEMKHIKILMVLGSVLAGLMVIPNTLPGRVMHKICLASPPFTMENKHWFVPLLNISMVGISFVVVLISYSLIAFYIKIKRRNFSFGKNDLFSLKVGFFLSCLFAVNYFTPFLALMIRALPKVYDDVNMMFNVLRLFSNLTFIDSIIMPVMFLVKSKQLRGRVISVCKRPATVAPVEHIAM